jgi:hypothetical protein
MTVLTPFGGGQPFDLVVHLGESKFVRIQCKTARQRGGVMLFNARTTDHGRGRVPYLGLADVFGVYAPWSDSVYLVPVEEALTYVHTLRVEPTRNNQRRRIRFADAYRADRWDAARLAATLGRGRNSVDRG